MPPRDRVISVYLSEGEKARIEELAHAEGISVASYIRRAVLRDVRSSDDESTPKASKRK